MSSKSRTLEHFAQTAGVGDVLCHPNGAHIYTADCDGHIRVFSHHPLIQHIGPHSKQLDAQQPRQHTAAIHAIAFNAQGTRIASASADRTVKLHDTTASPTATTVTVDRAEELLSSDKAVPLCLAWLPSGNDVAVGSDDGVVRVVSALAGTSRQYRAHTTAVHSVAVSANGQCLASMDRHGTLVVWDVDSREKLLEEEKAVPRHEMATQLDKQPRLALVAFSPSLHLLATPAHNGAVALRSADKKWKVEHELTERTGNAETPVALAWSGAGTYLLVVSRTRCVVWQVADGDMGSSSVIAQLALGGEERVLSAVWSARDNSVLMMRDDGWMKKWNDVVPAHLPQPHSEAADEVEAVDTAQLRPLGDMDDDDEEDGDELEGHAAGGAEGKEEADGQRRRRLRRAGDATAATAAADVAEVDFDDDDMNDFIVDDTDGLYRDNDDDYLSRKARASVTSSNHTQPPFQPASTPPDPTTRRRYLAYNLTGSVVSTPPSDHAPFHSIEIVFADSATHRTQRLKDHYGFSLSALGEHGCALAKVWESSQRPSVVFYRELAAWTANSDWTVHLPSPETATALAVTNKHVAVATDRQWVRLLSFSGRQCAVLSMPGPVIAMAGGRDALCVVYAAGMPLPNNQLLHARVLDPQRAHAAIDVPLPLSPGATLTWLGYSDRGGLLAMDSSGVLRLLSTRWGGQWAAVLDLSRKPGKDVHWPVGLIDDKLMCAVLKAGSGQKVPSTLSRPVLTALPVELPFVQTESSSVEQQHARTDLMLYEAQYAAHASSASASASGSALQPFKFQPSVKEQASLDKLLLPVIQLAIKHDAGSRALDLTAQLCLQRSMESALTLAQTNRKVHLASRISLLLGERRKQEEEERERKRAAAQGAAARAISVTEYINKADKKVTDERKRRLEQQKLDDAAPGAGKAKAAAAALADDEQSDAGDEGESELTYGKNGKKRVKLVERAEVLEERADSARQDREERDEEARKRQERDKSDREQMVVEDDGITTEQSGGAASGGGGVDFLTQFRKQKEKEKREKEEAEERGRERAREKKKSKAKAKAAAGTPAKANNRAAARASPEKGKSDGADGEKENSRSGVEGDARDGGDEPAMESQQESQEKYSQGGKERDAGAGSLDMGGLRKSVNPFAKRVDA